MKWLLFQGLTKKCGFSDDNKPLGFPFDRPTTDNLQYLRDFSADFENMISIDCKITNLK